ncbi:MAG TPA: hypothetical protein VJT31_29755 [Rugosimonospora sp.]|nr:hypothetical protein [Rugosimonospora sp.]
MSRLSTILRPWLTLPGAFALALGGYTCYALVLLVLHGRWGAALGVVTAAAAPELLAPVIVRVLRRTIARRLVEAMVAGTTGRQREDLLTALAASPLVGPELADRYRTGR